MVLFPNYVTIPIVGFSIGIIAAWEAVRQLESRRKVSGIFKSFLYCRNGLVGLVFGFMFYGFFGGR